MSRDTKVMFEHEFRITFSVIGLAFIFSGLVDGLVEDFTLKFFIIAGIWTALWWFSLYEMIWYPTPSHPIIESLVLLLAFISGAFGIHSAVWLIVSVMIGRRIEASLWLAPNIYIERNLFFVLTAAFVGLYLTLLAIVNTYTTEKRG